MQRTIRLILTVAVLASLGACAGLGKFGDATRDPGQPPYKQIPAGQ